MTATPLDYVRSLFNSYANHYEAHLVQTLHYQVPALMYQMLRLYTGVENNRWHILDLGCGTGLCGQAFTAYAASLTGVDLSDEMLKLAAEKQIYDEIIQADIISYLQHASNQYDLVIASDVFSYFGCLDLLISLISGAVKQEGLLMFSVEKSEQADYEMTDSGRFIHSKQYVDCLAQDKQFVLLQSQEVILRLQEDRPVLGYLYLLKKR
jgi:predicted TPR repeat methyltransferase